MCEFKSESGVQYRGYASGHCFAGGVQITAAAFYAALRAIRIAAMMGGVA